jgi:hypothetical protein
VSLLPDRLQKAVKAQIKGPFAKGKGEISEEFYGRHVASSDGGGSHLFSVCDCNRIHFTVIRNLDDVIDYDNPRLYADLLFRSQQFPDWCIPDHEDWPETITIDGRTAVIGCPCRLDVAFEAAEKAKS